MASEKNQTFLASFVCCIIAFLLNLISFVSPYWYQSWPRVHSKFVRLGLWEACFDGYIHPQDYNSKSYVGCWWVFSHEFRPIWEWLCPPWVITVQVMMTLNILIHIGVTAIIAMAFLRCCTHNSTQRILDASTGLMFFSAVLFIISIIVYCVKCEDRTWMPRPDHNHLSWAFGFAVLSGFLTLIAAFLIMLTAKNEKKLEPKMLQHPDSIPMHMQEPPPHMAHMHYGGPPRI